MEIAAEVLVEVAGGECVGVVDACWRLGRVVGVVFDVADLQGSRRCRDCR